jgi:hypothetical protein
MLNRGCFYRLGALILLVLFTTPAVWADTLIAVNSQPAQGANDFVNWSQLGADATLLGATFGASSVGLVPVTATLAGANSVISVVCTASPCSWTGSGFTAADSLLWTSDAGNSGNGPVTLAFLTPITGAGAMIQANAPGQFTAQIQAFNGATLLGTFTVLSDAAGDAVYIGVQDQTAANITKVVFSITACGPLDLSGCTDFAIDTVNLNAGPAVAFLSAHSLSFGAQPLGIVSSQAPAIVLNLGGAFMTINSVATSGGNSSDFSVNQAGCISPVAPAGNCLLSVTFTPTAAGPRKSSVSISDTAGGSPQTIILTGVGTAASLSPTILPFAPEPVGTSSAALPTTLTNKGSLTMNLWQIAILGTNPGDFSQTNTCASTLAPGVPCTVNVIFKPTATGARSATLLISDDGGGSPQAVTLTGTGI